MPRKARMHEVGDVHHVMAHGIDFLNLFDSELDCTTFLSFLELNLTKYECRCYGFSLMDNHYHLLLRPSKDNFSAMMQALNSRFARYINKTRGRRGYVFRDRFKSIPTRNIDYIRQLLLYINANPLRAGKVGSVAQLEQYRWSSHHCYCGGDTKSFPWVHTEYLSALFRGNDAYLGALRCDVEEDAELNGGVAFDGWIVDEQCQRINDTAPAQICSEEAAWVRETIRRAAEHKRTREALMNRPGIIQELMHKAFEHYQVKPDHLELSIQTRQMSKAVGLFCHWAIGKAGFSGAFIGRLLGKSGTAVLRAAARGAESAIALPL